MSFDQLIEKKFFNREWVFNKINKSLLDPSCPGVIISGLPGSGKTSISCQLIPALSSSSLALQTNINLLCFFIIPPSHHWESVNNGHNNGGCSLLIDFIRKIHNQLSASPVLIQFNSSLPSDFSEIQTNADKIFKERILDPLQLNEEKSSNVLFMLIDGLNDMKNVNLSQTIFNLVTKHLPSFPSWLKLIITTRRQGKMFEGMKKIRIDDLRKSHVVRDVQQFILSRLEREEKLKQQLDRRTAEMLNQLHIKSDGCFLYLEKSLDVVARGFVPLQEIKDIPATLNGFYLWLCQKLFSKFRFEHIRPILAIVWTLGGCIKESDLFPKLNTRFNFSLSKYDMDEKLELIRHIILIERSNFGLNESNNKHSDPILEVFHHSFVDWTLDVKYCTRRFLCKISEGHSSLAIHLISESLNRNSSSSSSSSSGSGGSSGRSWRDVCMDAYKISYHLSRSDFKFETPLLSLILLYSFSSLPTKPILPSLLLPDSQPDLPALDIMTLAGFLTTDKQADVMTSSFYGNTSVDDQSELENFSPSTVPDPFSSLASAAFQGNFPLLQLLLEASGAEFLEKGDPVSGETPLILASKQGHIEIVEALLEAGAHVDAEDKEGVTALKSAAWGGHLDCVTLLLKKQAQVEKADSSGKTPLFSACWCGHEKIVQLLIEKGSDPNRQDEDGRSCMMSASYLGHLNVVLLLLSNGADVNLKDPEGRTALFVACSGVGLSSDSRLKIVEALLDAGSSVGTIDVDGVTPLISASCQGRSELCELLLEHDADLDAEDVEGRTALDWAVLMGQILSAKTLLFWGACVDAIDPDGRTLLGNACQQGSVEMVGLLLDRGLDEMHRDNYGWTALHIAAHKGHVEIIQVLLEAGSHVNEIDNEGKTPFFVAVQEDHFSSAALLAEIGMCLVDCKSHDMRTPLMVCGGSNKMKLFEYLVMECKADVRRVDAFDRNVLHYIALENGNDEDAIRMIDLILDAHPTFNLNLADDEGQTVLHCCSWLGRNKLCQVFLQRGADVNHVDFENRSPLLLAAWQNQPEVADVLLRFGAKPGIRSLDGATPLAVCVQEGHDKVVRVLLKHSKLGQFFPTLKVLEDQTDVRSSGEENRTEDEGPSTSTTAACAAASGGGSSGCVSGDSAADDEDIEDINARKEILVKYNKPGKFKNKIKKPTDNNTTITTTTSGISSIEATYSTSLAIAATSSAATSAASRFPSSDRSCGSNCSVVAGCQDSSSSSAEVSKTQEKINDNINNSAIENLDFAKEINKLSNPRKISYRSSRQCDKTGSSNVTRRPNKKKEPPLTRDGASSSHSFSEVCCVSRKSAKNQKIKR